MALVWRRDQPIGVVLAGGLGRRIGGSKATVELNGRPLISYPVEAMRAALGSVAVVAKPDTELPSLPGVAIWIEPPEPRHPLIGILHALQLADPRPVLVCAADLPFVTTEAIRRLARSDPQGRPAVVAACGREVQPLLGCYQPGAAAMLALLVADGRCPRIQEAIDSIHPTVVDIGDPEQLFNVNAPDDLLMASAMLDRRRTR